MTDTTTPTDYRRHWYAIDYAPEAPQGLPPYFEADDLFTYADHDGTWVVATWRNEPTETARCILRVARHHVEQTSRHRDLPAAATAYAT